MIKPLKWLIPLILVIVFISGCSSSLKYKNFEIPEANACEMNTLYSICNADGKKSVDFQVPIEGKMVLSAGWSTCKDAYKELGNTQDPAFCELIEVRAGGTSNFLTRIDCRCYI